MKKKSPKRKTYNLRDTPPDAPVIYPPTATHDLFVRVGRMEDELTRISKIKSDVITMPMVEVAIKGNNDQLKESFRKECASTIVRDIAALKSKLELINEKGAPQTDVDKLNAAHKDLHLRLQSYAMETKKAEEAMSSRITSNYENAYTGDQELATRISALELRMVNVETSINCANPFRVTMNQAGSVGYVTTTSLIAAPKFTQQEACELVNKLIKEVLLCPDSADAFVELFKARDEIIARMTTAVQA